MSNRNKFAAGLAAVEMWMSVVDWASTHIMLWLYTVFLFLSAQVSFKCDVTKKAQQVYHRQCESHFKDITSDGEEWKNFLSLPISSLHFECEKELNYIHYLNTGTFMSLSSFIQIAFIYSHIKGKIKPITHTQTDMHTVSYGNQHT